MRSVVHFALFVLAAAPCLSHKIQRRTTPLNKTLTNTIPNLSGPVLYYNGSGNVPGFDTVSPQPEPLPQLTTQQIASNIVKEITAIGAGGLSNDDCTTCQGTLEALHIASLFLNQDALTEVMISLCKSLNTTSVAQAFIESFVDYGTCESYLAGSGGEGYYLAQLLQKLSLETGDMQAICYYEFSVCDPPPLVEINEADWFPPKPANKTTAPVPSGKTINILHFSDWHMDPRFDIGSEANCTNGLCCRFDSYNAHSKTGASNPDVPASRFGDFLCDTPPDLALSMFTSMRHSLDLSVVPWAIFTGDVVSHDPEYQESRALIEYEENIAYETFRAQLGAMPVYVTLGNHDTYPSAFNEPNGFRNDSEPNEMAWDYETVSSLWQHQGWVDSAAASYAANHYGAYATTTKEGLKIISINTDFWYTPNVFNYYDYANPDKSGILSFLISELLAAETADQRVWIIGHVPSGGSSAAGNPSILFHSIVARFSPATIAGVFFGHTHKDEKQIFYDFKPNSSDTTTSVYRNYTDLAYNLPIAVAFVGPSLVPLTDYNAGWSVYQVDAETFEVVNGQVYIANISNTLNWEPEPEWEFEYDIREIYDPSGEWPATAPLNATFWNTVTDRMETNASLVDEYTFLSWKSSALTPKCTGSCLNETICEIRSSNAAVYDLCAGI